MGNYTWENFYQHHKTGDYAFGKHLLEKGDSHRYVYLDMIFETNTIVERIFRCEGVSIILKKTNESLLNDDVDVLRLTSREEQLLAHILYVLRVGYFTFARPTFEGERKIEFGPKKLIFKSLAEMLLDEGIILDKFHRYDAAIRSFQNARNFCKNDMDVINHFFDDTNIHLEDTESGLLLQRFLKLQELIGRITFAEIRCLYGLSKILPIKYKNRYISRSIEYGEESLDWYNFKRYLGIPFPAYVDHAKITVTSHNIRDNISSANESPAKKSLSSLIPHYTVYEKEIPDFLKKIESEAGWNNGDISESNMHSEDAAEKDESDIDKDGYRKYCKDKHLLLSYSEYLNDETMKTDKMDDLELEIEDPTYSRHFQDIVSAFDHCRWLLWNCDIYDNNKEYVSQFSNERKIQLLQDCFLRLYSILDKLSYLLNMHYSWFSEDKKLDLRKIIGKIKEDDPNPVLPVIRRIFLEIDPDFKPYCMCGERREKDEKTGCCRRCSYRIVNRKQKVDIPYYKIPSISSQNVIRNHIAHSGFTVNGEDIKQDKFMVNVSYERLYTHTRDLICDIKEAIMTAAMTLSWEKERGKFAQHPGQN